MEKTYDNLQELTHQESGAIQYDDSNEIMILNWSSIEGLPRIFVTGYLGFAEKITARRTATPREIIQAMQDHETEQDPTEKPSKDGYKAWRVNDCATIVINWRWA